MKMQLKWGLYGAAALLVAAGGIWYHHHSLHYPSTDDAYIKADIVDVAPEVGGRVVTVPVSNHTRVQRGQLLFRIDPASYRLRWQQAQARLQLAQQQVTAQVAAVDAARAAVADAKARAANARLHFQRVQHLAALHTASQAQRDDASAGLKSADASVALMRARLVEAQKELGATGDANQRVREARAALQLAQLDLQHTQIDAPCDGQLSGVRLQPGDVVKKEAAQFVLVCTRRYWVYANLKETDLARVRPGQFARISVDMYPDHVFRGVVESINPASGAAFSLLPPENATGNWVKVTQRVPVRILIVDASAQYPLRVQTSASVTIDTGPGKPLGEARDAVLSNAQAEALARRRQPR